MIFDISDPIYGSLLHCFIGEPSEKMDAHIDKNYPDFEYETVSETADACCRYLNDRPIAYLWTEHKKTNIPEVHGILAHEINHYAMHIFSIIGVPFVSMDDNDETFCYFVQFVTREVYQGLSRKNP